MARPFGTPVVEEARHHPVRHHPVRHRSGGEADDAGPRRGPAPSPWPPGGPRAGTVPFTRCEPAPGRTDAAGDASARRSPGSRATPAAPDQQSGTPAIFAPPLMNTLLMYNASLPLGSSTSDHQLLVPCGSVTVSPGV